MPEENTVQTPTIEDSPPTESEWTDDDEATYQRLEKEFGEPDSPPDGDEEASKDKEAKDADRPKRTELEAVQKRLADTQAQERHWYDRAQYLETTLEPRIAALEGRLTTSDQPRRQPADTNGDMGEPPDFTEDPDGWARYVERKAKRDATDEVKRVLQEQRQEDERKRQEEADAEQAKDDLIEYIGANYSHLEPSEIRARLHEIQQEMMDWGAQGKAYGIQSPTTARKFIEATNPQRRQAEIDQAVKRETKRQYDDLKKKRTQFFQRGESVVEEGGLSPEQASPYSWQQIRALAGGQKLARQKTTT